MVGCRLMDLPSFAAEARQEEAVLLNCVQSEVGDNGYLQSFLHQKEVQVLHTGSDVQATALCHDKVSTPPSPLPHSPLPHPSLTASSLTPPSCTPPSPLPHCPVP